MERHELSYFERGPKMEVEDVRERLEDYIGQPWNGLKWALEAANDPDLVKKDWENSAREHWQEIFRRVRAFLDSDFEESEIMTRKNIERLLQFEDMDFFDPKVVEQWEEVWYDIRNREREDLE